MEKWRKKTVGTLIVAVVMNVVICSTIGWLIFNLSAARNQIADKRESSISQLKESDTTEISKERFLNLENAIFRQEMSLYESTSAFGKAMIAILGVNIFFGIYCLSAIKKASPSGSV